MNPIFARFVAMAVAMAGILQSAHAATLLSHWAFDESSGTTAHDSAGSVNGTLTNGAAFVPGGGVRGGAVSLNKASNQFVDMGNTFDFTADFSVVAWVKLSSGDTTSEIPLARHHGTIVAGYLLAINDVGDGCSAVGKAHFYAGYPCSGTSSISVNDGKWHQLVGTYQGGTNSIYVDGQFQSSASGSGLVSIAANFRVGAVTDNSAGFPPIGTFTGMVDEVSVYVGALNPGEVLNLYNGVRQLQFYPLPPCRVADTRSSQPFTGAFGPPSLAAFSSRTFPILSSGCSIPSNAQAYSLNFTVVPSVPLGFLSVWPAGDPYPGVSTLNSTDGSVIANAAIVPTGVSGSITTLASNPTDLIIDINGYFAPPSASGLDFFSVTPCRVADTRSTQPYTGAFGPPSLSAFVTRDFPISTSPCLTGSEYAYSLNVTVVPPGPVSFLSAWPLGQAYPGVSTLNSPGGATIANAAIIPAGVSGDIDVVASNTTDLIIDINGKFAAPVAGGLQFYTLTPCRVADTRSGQPTGPFGPPTLAAYSGRNFPIQASPCGIPAAAQAYALNLTAVPPGPLSFLSVWPAGQAYPGVSALNSPTGDVIANLAIVPAGTGGAITVLGGNPTDLVIDIVGFFAP